MGFNISEKQIEYHKFSSHLNALNILQWIISFQLSKLRRSKIIRAGCMIDEQEQKTIRREKLNFDKMVRMEQNRGSIRHEIHAYQWNI